MARHEWASPIRNDPDHRTLHPPQLWAHRSGSHRRRPKGVYKTVDRQTRWLGSYGGRGTDRSDLRKRKRLFAPDWQIAGTDPKGVFDQARAAELAQQTLSPPVHGEFVFMPPLVFGTNRDSVSASDTI